MERIVASGNFITRNVFLITVSFFYLAAMTGPAWGLGWGSGALIPWSAAVLALVLASTWRYLRPGRRFPKTDLSFIIPVIIAINLFSVLLGDGGEWVRPMNFLLVALCALFYSLWFNLAVAGLIFVMEWANVFFSPGPAGAQTSVSLGVYGAYLGCIPLVLGRLFHFEYKKKESAIREIKRLKEGAETLKPENSGSGPISSISEEARAAGDVGAAAMLERRLGAVLETARCALRADNALVFLPSDGGEAVTLRVTSGDGPFGDVDPVRPGQGLIGWVLKEKKPVMVKSRATGLAYVEKEGRVNSFLATPILDGGRLEGIIAVDSAQGEMFTETDRGTLDNFGSIALEMIASVRMWRSVDKEANKFEALNELGDVMSTSLNLETILENLSMRLKNVVPYDFMTISFVDKKRLVFRVVEGYPDGAKPEGPVPLDNTYLGWMVDTGEKLSFSDFNRRTSKMPIFPVKGLRSDFRSFYALPLKNNKGVVLGILTVALKRAGGIDGFQQDMLRVVAGQLAVRAENSKLHQRITLMATTDGLTGLINHRHFQEKADERFIRATRYPEDISLLIFDIDHFKNVNDTYGHPIGDAVLRKVGAIVRETARTVDITARYGGEEFAVLMENTDEAGAMKMAERIRTAIQKTKFVFEGNTVPVTVSIGCASFPSHASDKKELVDRADKSLYWAKRNGRNRCCAFSSIAGSGDREGEN